MNRFGSPLKPLMWLMAILLAAFVAGCGGGGGGDGGTPAAAPAPVDPVGAVCTVGAACVDLKTAGTYVILAQSGITNVPTSAVTGHMGVGPAVTSTAITGFALVLPAGGAFSTSSQVVGNIFAKDYAAPTATNLTTAVADSIAAYGDAFLRAHGVGFLNEFAGDVSGKTIAPGVHKWGTNVVINSDVTLSGNATDVWILQIDGNVIQADATKVTLTGGALPENVFWQVGGGTGVAIGNNAQFRGIVLTGKAVTVGTGSSITGRLFTGTNVTLQGNTVTRPGS